MVTIVSVASKNYLPYLRALVLSAKTNYSNAKMVVELINVSDTEANEFYKNHHNIKIKRVSSSEERGLDFGIKNASRNIVHGKTKDMIDAERGFVFCSNRKCYTMYEERETGNTDILLWIDADTLLRPKCDEIENHINHDITLRVKTGQINVNGRMIREVFGGVFAFGNSPNANVALKQYVEMTRKNTYLGADQNHLAYVYATDSINRGVLPDQFMDFKVKPSSPVWTCKCEPKTINGRFHSVRAKILEEWVK